MQIHNETFEQISPKYPGHTQKAEKTLCFRNALLMKISPQFTFMNKKDINKKMPANKNFLLKRKEILGIQKKFGMQ